MIESAIYDAHIRHRRREPADELHHDLRYAYLDLDAVPASVARRSGWSTRPAPVWFRRRDYLDGGDRPMKEVLAELVLDRADLHLPGPVAVLTQLRTFGWLFNPLTTYYCFEPDGQTLAALVLEITNTPWHERFWYVLDAQQVDGRGLPFPKQFHVSPLLPMDLSYRCRAPVPGDRLALRFELSSGGAPIPSGDSAEGAASTNASTRVFDADLTGRRVSLDAPLTLRPALRSATQTALVSGGIYAHAASLRLRGAPLHRHPKHDDSPHTPRGALDPRTSP